MVENTKSVKEYFADSNSQTILYGTAHKLSNRQWSTNERLFQIDEHCLCYFSKTNDD